MTQRRAHNHSWGRAFAALLLAAAFGLSGFALRAQAAETEKAEDRFADRDERYRIRAGDVLSIQFRFTPEYDQKAKVQPDGYISLSGTDDLKVGGLSVEQVRDAVVEAFRSQLREPAVNVVLEEFSMPGYIVGGQVASPGRYELRGEVMLSEAIQMAGGFSPNAHTEQVLLFRRSGDGWMEATQVDFKKVLKGGLNEDIRLRPGDMVLIPRSKMGNVGRFMDAARVGAFFTPWGLL